MTNTRRQINYCQAISEALVQGMDQDPKVFLFGLGVSDCRGIFATTIEANRRFGPSRVFDVPASENALSGIAIGAALAVLEILDKSQIAIPDVDAKDSFVGPY